MIVIPDADVPGRNHAHQVAESCHGAGLTVTLLPAFSDAKDVSEWFDKGHGIGELLTLAKTTATYSPPAATLEPVEASGLSTLDYRVLDELDRERAKREVKKILDAEARGASQPPVFRVLRDQLATPRTPITYRIQNWQPTNTRAMLAAQYKAGKTTLTGNVVRSLVDGDAFLGRDAVTPIAGSVVILDFEMNAEQSDEWLAAQRIRHDDRVIIVSLRGSAASFDILNDQVRADWARRLSAVSCRYLVLDCLRPLMDAIGLDEHRDAGRLLVAFDALLKEAGIPEALVMHHMGHQNERARGGFSVARLA